MISKTKPARTIKITTAIVNGRVTATKQFQSGSEVIQYDSGRRFQGHWPWKQCIHVSDGIFNPQCGFAELVYEYPSWAPSRTRSYLGRYCYNPTSMYALPAALDPRAAAAGIMSQLDLNSKENVLLYSGIVQAVPLLGSVLRLNSILSRAAKKLSKSFKRKPFTTVLKTLISADFVDRFVISPTLDDARRFQDATDYVLRVIQTARERSSQRFALQSEVNTTVAERDDTFEVFTNGNLPSLRGTAAYRSVTSCKAFALLEARYDVNSLSPIKIWAQRVGLTRPLDSVWDLVPFSFVVDYFTRAGDFISHLSDEMSNVEGLRGTITKIHDLWYTTTQSSTCSFKGTSWNGGARPEDDPYYHVLTRTQALGQGSKKYVRFVRKRIPNPYGFLLPLSDQPEDYLRVTLVPSATRMRTIAELLIQAKL